MSKFVTIPNYKPLSYEKNKWIEMFQEMDIDKPPPLNIKLYKGQSHPRFCKGKQKRRIQLMYDLKEEIGHLSERSQLSHLKNHPAPFPIRPNFDPNDPDHHMMAQAFYQDALYYYEFISDYTAYLEELIAEQSNNSIKMNTPSPFYKDIADQLYLYNYKINGTDFFTMEAFIEQKYKMAEFKGEVFYLNLIQAMPRVGNRIADPEKGEIQTPREKVFRSVLDYCNAKIKGIRPKADPSKPVVFFSYAWNENSDTFVSKLYDNLKKDGIGVVRDKNDLQYGQSISEFMRSIGKGGLIVIALSDKYLKSENCMFELCEIYRNSRQEMEELRKRIISVRIENLKLDNPETVNEYLNHWKDREQQWKSLVNSHGYTQEQHRRVEAIYNSSKDLLFFLKDINASSLELLTQDDFAIIKKTIEEKASVDAS